MEISGDPGTVNKFTVLFLLYFLVIFVSAARADSGVAQAQAAKVVTTLPPGLSSVASDQPSVQPLVEYGEFLFFFYMLSHDQSVSCGSCHVARFGNADSRQLAVGVDGRVGRRRSPPLFNLFAAKTLMLDGRAASLVDQVHFPLESADEMAIDWTDSLQRLRDLPQTRHLLSARPPAVLDRDLVIAALAAYDRTLVAGGSAFDRYYFGKDERAISDEAKEGFRLFVRKGRCSGCHQVTAVSAMLTDDNFHSTGIGWADGKYADDGRFEVTGAETDKGLFKTPTLRNVALRPYFMHDGSLRSLREVIDYYNRGGNHGAANLDGRIQPLSLSQTEIQQILAFLDTLSAEVVSYRPWLGKMGGGQ